MYVWEDLHVWLFSDFSRLSAYLFGSFVRSWSMCMYVLNVYAYRLFGACVQYVCVWCFHVSMSLSVCLHVVFELHRGGCLSLCICQSFGFDRQSTKPRRQELERRRRKGWMRIGAGREAARKLSEEALIYCCRQTVHMFVDVLQVLILRATNRATHSVKKRCFTRTCSLKKSPKR